MKWVKMACAVDHIEDWVHKYFEAGYYHKLHNWIMMANESTQVTSVVL